MSQTGGVSVIKVAKFGIGDFRLSFNEWEMRKIRGNGVVERIHQGLENNVRLGEVLGEAVVWQKQLPSGRKALIPRRIACRPCILLEKKEKRGHAYYLDIMDEDSIVGKVQEKGFFRWEYREIEVASDWSLFRHTIMPDWRQKSIFHR